MVSSLARRVKRSPLLFPVTHAFSLSQLLRLSPTSELPKSWRRRSTSRRSLLGQREITPLSVSYDPSVQELTYPFGFPLPSVSTPPSRFGATHPKDTPSSKEPTGSSTLSTTSLPKLSFSLTATSPRSRSSLPWEREPSGTQLESKSPTSA